MNKEYAQRLKKRSVKEKKNRSSGGIAVQLMAITPLMKKKIEENRTVFGNEPTLQKEQLEENSDESKNIYLKVDEILYKDQHSGETLSRKINEDYLWNKVVKDGSKSGMDYKIVAKEIGKKHLESNEEFVNVKYSTYTK
ncbi:MAG: hypothetical protein U9Q33_12640 [Campylobacterota bacterium]|nr:hypothetical protein [Campylobacterota bacterium]